MPSRFNFLHVFVVDLRPEDVSEGLFEFFAVTIKTVIAEGRRIGHVWTLSNRLTEKKTPVRILLREPVSDDFNLSGFREYLDDLAPLIGNGFVKMRLADLNLLEKLALDRHRTEHQGLDKPARTTLNFSRPHRLESWA